MPPRECPTARQARLGAELRKMRKRAGKTALEAAALIASDRAKISHIEAGRNGISEERIRRLAAFYGCEDSAYVDALCAISREHRGQFWWDEYRGILPPGFLDIAELEYHATYLRAAQALVIPGILQTESYARAVFSSAVAQLPPTELDARVEHRMRRRVIFDRTSPPMYEAIVHEAALRMRYGGRKVLRAQLENLLELTVSLPVTIRIIPFDVEEITASTQSTFYAGGPVPALDTVQIDDIHQGGFLDAEIQLLQYRRLLEALERASLNAEESRKFIHQITQGM
jgi:transcriptional regulator with XRE-family HTH domain